MSQNMGLLLTQVRDKEKWNKINYAYMIYLQTELKDVLFYYRASFGS